MPSVADYDIVHDATIQLAAGPRFKKMPSSQDFPLETPGINVVVRAVLSYMLHPLDEIEYTFSIVNAKGTKVVALLIDEPGAASVRQRVISAGLLMPSGNTLRVEVTSGIGTFGEIVLWYQTNI
jgi:hypothetical protein